MIAEDRRQLAHAGAALLIVPLRWLPPWAAIALAVVGVLVGWLVLPRTAFGRGIRRDGEPWLDGAKLYPVAVLALLVALRVEVAAAAWAVLGIGDAASNVLGRRFGRPPFLGRGDRSLVGSLAFVATAAPAAVAAHAWVSAAEPGREVVVAALAASAAGAAVELLIPRGRDDNLPVGLAAGAVLHFML